MPDFVPMKLEEEREDRPDTFTIRLNQEERECFEKDKKILNQKKDSTAMKKLAELGSIVLHDNLIGQIIRAIYENRRRNRRTGISDFDD